MLLIAIQICLNEALKTGGTVFFPGKYKISKTMVMDTKTSGKYINLKGNGLGSTSITVINDVSAFEIGGYLYNISDMVINCGVSNSTKYGIRMTGGGRRELNRLQITSFYHAIYQDGWFDQFSIDKVKCSNSLSHGMIIHINDSSSCALLRVTDSLFNNSNGHGVL